MDSNDLKSRLDFLDITQRAVKHFEGARDDATINRNNAIATNQDGAKQLYEEKIKIATEQVNFYKAVENKIISELITYPEYVSYLQDIGMAEKKETSIQMR